MTLDSIGIPTAKINQFQKKGIETIEDLVRFFPRKYYDFRNPVLISSVKDGDICAVIGVIHQVTSEKTYFKVSIRDETNQFMSIVWFMPKESQKYHNYTLKPGKRFVFCGKIKIDEQYHSRSMASPFYFSENIERYSRIVPVYSKIQGMADEFLQQSMESALAIVNKDDYLEPIMLNKFSLIKTSTAFRGVHQPQEEADIEAAKRRFIFDDLFVFAMQLVQAQKDSAISSPYVMPKMNAAKALLNSLPFALTDGQRKALHGMCEKIRSGERLSALVQGDVGCGKTIVAFMMMVVACDNGLQSALMCPTTVLANQHYEELLSRLAVAGISCRVTLLTSELTQKERKIVLQEIEKGNIDIIVGTHSVISKTVKFKNLALTVVDEEHRFGVVQRNQIKEKAKDGVHNITMSATPIPRTLATSIYGEDLGVYTIETLPNGRLPIKTVSFRDEIKTYEAMYRQIQEGRQCYVICPLVEGTETEDEKSEEKAPEEKKRRLDSVVTTYEKITSYFSKHKGVKIGMVTGNKKVTSAENVKNTLDQFTKNEIQILVATTVIEVGVNIPNASVMVIKDADRFGLAQLHQLRGRVGRGEYQSYCVLLTPEKDNPKIAVMCDTTDGFKIAEEDLKLRGMGDFVGTKQSGSNKYVMLMLANLSLFEDIKKEVKEIYADESRANKYVLLNDVDISDK